jgi:hypothetical protein
MGTVEFKGFPAAIAAALSEKWRLKAGDVYDQSYGGRFLQEEAAPILSRIVQARREQQKPPPNLNIDQKPNRQTLIVNVTVEMKN